MYFRLYLAYLANNSAISSKLGNKSQQVPPILKDPGFVALCLFSLRLGVPIHIFRCGDDPGRVNVQPRVGSKEN